MEDQKDKQCRIIFLQPIFIIFTRGAINSEHDCMLTIIHSNNHSITHMLTMLQHPHNPALK